MRVFVVPLLLFVGCMPPKRATLEQLAARSSFDLACPPMQMQLYDFGERAKGVAGCGRRLTYVEQCEAGSCAWVIDSPAEIGWTAPPAPTPRPAAPPPGPPPAAPLATAQPGDRDWGF